MKTKRFFTKLGLDNPQMISWSNQLARIRFTILMSLAAASSGIGGVYLLSLLTETPLGQLTKDPAIVTKSTVHIGILSNLGLMVWAAAAAICFWGAFVLSYAPRCRRSTRFLFVSGALTLFLMFDDAFLFHEEIIPRYLGLSQHGVYLGYLILTGGYFIYSFRHILVTEYLLLVAALFFLGASLALDVVMRTSSLQTFIEDGLKFTGILFWLGYFARTVSVIVRERCNLFKT